MREKYPGVFIPLALSFPASASRQPRAAHKGAGKMQASGSARHHSPASGSHAGTGQGTDPAGTTLPLSHQKLLRDVYTLD